MSDTLTTVRCPRCGGVTEEFIYHRAGVTGPRTTRTECPCCGHVAEHTEGERPQEAPKP
jgi:endogenous inhibitor of DNA gyrase (YacG/DUF329 family)